MKITYRAFLTLLVLLLLNQNFILAQNREIVRIATYNILNYSDEMRNSDFKKVLDEIKPDIVIVQEILTQYGVNVFRSGVLGDEYVAGFFINGPNTDNAIFYKDSLLTLIDNRNIPTTLRDISEYTLVHNFSGDTLILYSVHLKASEDDTTRRRQEVNVLRSVTDNLPVGTNYIVLGDFNIYRSSEGAYQNLINQSNSGYVIDPQIAGNWHTNIAYASIHTQSTCGLLSGCPNGGSGGGMDDRFDMILFSQSVSDTGGITFIDNSYTSFGNDGQHFNNSINEPPFNIITQEVANALYNSSDHLPVYADFDFGIISDVEFIDDNEMSYSLQQNYPNPFNPSTVIEFSLPEDLSNVKLTIYNVLGQRVAELVNTSLRAGKYNYQWNASGVAAGMYVYELRTNNFISIRKMVLMK